MKKTAFVLFLFLGMTVHAFAKCASWTQTESERVSRAKEIFVAEIMEAHVKNNKDGIAEETYGKYRLIESIKGKPKHTGSVHSILAVPGIALTPGSVYLFFIYNDSFYVDWCGGARVLNSYYDLYENDDIKLINRLKEIVEK